MKLYRNAIILVVILALLIGVYVIFKNKKADSVVDPSTTSTVESIKILAVKQDDIIQINVDNNENKLIFDKKGSDWVATQPANLKVLSSKIGDIAFDISYFYANSIVEENATNLALYGLDKPTVISAKMKNGDVYSYELGNMTPTKSGYYLKEKGKNKIYIINSYKAEAFLARYDDIIDKTLLSTPIEKITAFSLERAGSLVFSTKKISDSQWSMTKPVPLAVNFTRLTEVLKSVAAVSAKELAERNATDLDKFGLKNPLYAVEVQSSSGKVKLFIGNERTRGTDEYAKLDGSNDVFVIDEAALSFLDITPKEVADSFVELVNIKDISAVTVNMDGKSDTSQIDGTNKKYKFNGKSVESLKGEDGTYLFNNYYQALIGLTVDELYLAATPSGTAEVTITFKYIDPSKALKIELVSKDNDYYYVLKNGVYCGVLLEKAQLDQPNRIRDANKKLLEGIAKMK